MLPDIDLAFDERLRNMVRARDSLRAHRITDDDIRKWKLDAVDRVAADAALTAEIADEARAFRDGISRMQESAIETLVRAGVNLSRMTLWSSPSTHEQGVMVDDQLAVTITTRPMPATMKLVTDLRWHAPWGSNTDDVAPSAP